MNRVNVQNLIGAIASMGVMLLSLQHFVPVQLTPLEAIAAITSAWSVWLLAKNDPLGWWIGLIGVVAYIVVFFQVKLYGDVAIQIFYLVTSVQGIYLWLRGGENKTEKSVGHINKHWLLVSLALGIFSVIGLRVGLIALDGAVPFWDSLTTVGSAIAQIYLMERYIESWYLWIALDLIYIPLYASRGLYLTSVLYAIFFAMAIYGLKNFQHIYRQQKTLK